ncbi:helix-turn-helix transcriptional regulator [Variovorax sp. Root434]|uniref:helix-turn-helix transcriptional regulator n=1 Tax=Variovorax sp. Root434 TaxID=1736536 RepID=UPI0009EA1A5F|nr:response regulator transcription factor [Variovorax sp. Root434]
MSKEKSRRIATRPEQGSRESSSVHTAGSNGGEPRMDGFSDGVPHIDSSTSSTAAALLFAKAAQQELVLLMRLIAEGDSATAMRIAWCIVERGRAVLGPELPPSASLPAQAKVPLQTEQTRLPPSASSGTGGRALSRRELDVLRMISQGLSNRQIAELSHRSLHTVDAHAKSIYRKLAVKSRAQAVRDAMQKGLIDLEACE